ncbi:MAG: DsrE family protein [Thaumarchaeota archaeon]|nr:DsrE family protein [Candidatus Terraquivivens yellowstonensis]
MGEKVALIINSGSFERVSYALTLAAMYAALGKEVSTFFTYGALFRLIKGRIDEVGEETDPTIRQKIKEGLEKGTIRSISEGINELKRFRGKIYACIAAMSFYDVTRDELINEVDEVMGIAAFLEATRGAQILYI